MNDESTESISFRMFANSIGSDTAVRWAIIASDLKIKFAKK